MATKIEIEGGKYTIVHENGAALRVYRHGELWQNLTGDNLVLAMCNEIEELKRKLKRKLEPTTGASHK